MPRSKLQHSVLNLYKQFLRAAETKPGIHDQVRREFRKHLVIPKTDGLRIEHLLVRGRRQLALINKPTVRGVGVFDKTASNQFYISRDYSAVMVGELAVVGLFKRVISHFPSHRLRMAFAYGSGVFQQEGHLDMSKNMVDFIFVVDEPDDWHRQNLLMNPSHYSFLKHFSARRIAAIQEHFGAGVYYNTLVPCEERMIKYGVIGTRALMNDLLDWETLYVSGRLHKPVNVVVHKEIPDLTSALITNHQSAVHAALLILPETFTEDEIYQTITSLSYSGDFRMTIGEDKNKIANIVKPNLVRFRHLYEPILDADPHVYWNKSSNLFEQSLCSTSRYHHLNLLPKMVQLGLLARRNRDGRSRDLEEVLHAVCHDSECSDHVRDSIVSIVKKSSLTQSAKGILTAGFKKTVQYSWSKLKKMMKSKRKK